MESSTTAAATLATTTTSTTTTTTTATPPPPPPPATAAKTSLKKKTSTSADSDLKSKIIEFMRDRPFLWNSKHPSYKDHKRREQEFQAFSSEINSTTQEVKRVWHVLRTNFFRAHKLLSERANRNGPPGENGEKMWKYYLAMEYILEGTPVGGGSNSASTSTSTTPSSSVVATPAGDSSTSNNHDISIKETSTSSLNTTSTSTPTTTRHTRSSRCSEPSSLTNSHNNNNHHYNLKSLKREANHNRSSFALCVTNPVVPNSTSASLNASLNSSLNSSGANNTNNSLSLAATAAAAAPSRSLAYQNDSPSIDMLDDDYSYARSLTSTLKRFDPTTKEIIKLKFQEIIVSYMQQQQQQNNNSSAGGGHQSG